MNVNLPKEISTKFIYTCMGFGNKEPDIGSIELVKKCSEIVCSSAVPYAVYNEFSIGIVESTGEVYVVNEKNILEGQAIAKHLEGCHKCVLMAVTLGPQIDKIIRRAQITDMAKAVALDACASALIEDLCDQINNQIIKEYKDHGMGLTTRFSPGYGDLPLASHNVFSNFLEMEKKIGLTQSSEHLLLPRKSITAIMGISSIEKSENVRDIENAVREENEIACEFCERKNCCEFRANGGYCGRKY